MNHYLPKNKTYFYNGLPEKSPVVNLKIVLDEEVRPEALTEAVGRIMKSDWFFRQRPVLNEAGDVFCRENEEEPPVYADDGVTVSLGSSDTRGYLFRVLYRGRTITLVFSHVLADFCGADMFFHAFLYEYFDILGYHPDRDDSIPKTDDMREDEGKYDLYEDLPGDLIPKGIPNMNNPFSIPGDRPLMDTDKSRTIALRYDSRDLKKVCKSFNCTPVTLFSVVISGAVHRIYEVGQDTIVTGMPVDMRSFMQRKALSNYSSMSFLTYEAELSGVPVDEQITLMAGKLREVLREDNLLSVAAMMRENGRHMPTLALDDPEAIQQMQRQKMSKKGMFTFLLTNVGLVRFPEQMKKHIERYEIEVVSVSYTPSILLYSFGEDGYFVHTANYESAELVHEVRSGLTDIGLECEVSFDGYSKNDVVRTELFAKSMSD